MWFIRQILLFFLALPGGWLALENVSAAAALPFEISDRMDGQPLGLHFEKLEDKDWRFTFDDVRRIEAEAGLQPSHEKAPNFGQNPAHQWIKFTLHNPTDHAIVTLLENKFTLVDEFTLYYQDTNQQWKTKRAGDQVSFAERDIQTRQTVFRFVLSPGIHHFYAHSMTEGAHQVPLHIWTHDEFFSHNAAEYGFIGILIGFHVVICLYNLFLFFSLKDRTYLFYVAYVTFNLFYQYSALGLLQQTMSQLAIAETASNGWLIVCVDLVSSTALLFSFHFLNIKERLPRFIKVYYTIGILDLANILITMFISVRLGTLICLATASLTTSSLILSGFLISRKGYLPAIFYLAGWGCYLFGVTGTVTNLLGLLPTNDFTRWGQFTGGALEIAILSLALGARINEKRRQTLDMITSLNEDLEDKVKERTSEIQSLLLHIPQGILSIGPNGLIDANYSAQLPKILGIELIAGESFRQVVLEHSTLSDDEKDQAWQTIMASLGESRLSFELNVDKLPHQLHYAVSDVKKVVNLTWNFDLNSKDEIKHILVTLLDVSSEVAAQQEIARQNQEFEIIRQLVDSGAKKSIQFFNAGDQLIEENERLIRAPVMDRDSIKILFVNTHTLKGAARTLQFRELANALHQVESYYSAIIKENQALDQARALREFLAARSVYQRYYKANRDILGRTDDVKKVSVDRDFLHQNVKFLRHLSDVDVLPFELRDVIHTWRHELTQLIFMSMPMILDDIMQQSEKIAKDLGREPPRVQLDADDILVSYSQELALKNAFIHMLRNALDHGIETPRARLDKGKPAQGTIQVKAWEQNGTIHLEFKDDGKGLPLGRIRDLTKVDAQTKPDVLASRIFEAGFSTAETVSQMSGRGIGLGAVRQFVEAEKGTVTIKLGRLIQAEGEFYEFSLHLTLPANASATGPLATSIAS